MLVGELADPKKGDRVIDVCAAPGGKALHVAEKLRGTGSVEARDLSLYKVGLITEDVYKRQRSTLQDRKSAVLFCRR